jgi:hypothetical protein
MLRRWLAGCLLAACWLPRLASLGLALDQPAYLWWGVDQYWEGGHMNEGAYAVGSWISVCVNEQR